MNIVVEDLQFLLDRYIEGSKVPNLPFEELKERIFHEFEENDKRRGIPYLTPARSIVANFINYSDDVVFEGRERPYTGTDFSSLYGDDQEDLPEPEGRDDKQFQDDLMALFNIDPNAVDGDEEDEDDSGTEVDTEVGDETGYGVSEVKKRVIKRVVRRKPEIAEDLTKGTASRVGKPSVPDKGTASVTVKSNTRSHERTKPTTAPSQGTAKPKSKVEEVLSRPRIPVNEELKIPAKVPDKPPVKVRKKVVKVRKKVVKAPSIPKTQPKVNEDINALLTDIFKEEPKPKQQERQRTYVSVRDLVLDNSGCTYDFVLKHFTQKQLTKDIESGKIYMKNGRLYA